MKIHSSLDTKASPTRVLAALTDFSDRRPDIWPSLDRERFQVHQLGDNWAEVTEGSAKPMVWARERYDWSDTNTVSWKVQESNFCEPGSGITVHISEGADGGSHLEIYWERTPSNLKWRLMFLPMKVALPAMFRKQWTAVLDGYAEAN